MVTHCPGTIAVSSPPRSPANIRPARLRCSSWPLRVADADQVVGELEDLDQPLRVALGVDALGDVAVVDDDALDVGVGEHVRGGGLDPSPPPGVAERVGALDLGLGRHDPEGAGDGAGGLLEELDERLLEPGEVVGVHPVEGVVPEDLVHRSGPEQPAIGVDLLDGAVGVEHDDRVAGVEHQRAEALLAAPQRPLLGGADLVGVALGLLPLGDLAEVEGVPGRGQAGHVAEVAADDVDPAPQPVLLADADDGGHGGRHAARAPARGCPRRRAASSGCTKSRTFHPMVSLGVVPQHRDDRSLIQCTRSAASMTTIRSSLCCTSAWRSTP